MISFGSRVEGECELNSLAEMYWQHIKTVFQFEIVNLNLIQAVVGGVVISLPFFSHFDRFFFSRRVLFELVSVQLYQR